MIAAEQATTTLAALRPRLRCTGIQSCSCSELQVVSLSVLHVNVRFATRIQAARVMNLVLLHSLHCISRIVGPASMFSSVESMFGNIGFPRSWRARTEVT